MTLLLPLLSGLSTGAVHVFSGPDHLAVVTPLAVDRSPKPWRVGLMWGMGHSGGVWLVAVLALFFRRALPIELISTRDERIVGLVLVAIGLWGWSRLLGARLHTHVHEHDGLSHIYPHLHKRRSKAHHPIDHTHDHTAWGIGALYGLAGTSHLLAVLPALMFPTQASAVTYVLAYGAGSIAAMTAFSRIVGLAASRCERRGDRLYRLVLGSTCSAAILVGCYWCYFTML